MFLITSETVWLCVCVLWRRCPLHFCVCFRPGDCVFVCRRRGSAAAVTASGSGGSPAPPPPAGWSPSDALGAAGCPEIAPAYKRGACVVFTFQCEFKRTNKSISNTSELLCKYRNSSKIQNQNNYKNYFHRNDRKGILWTIASHSPKLVNPASPPLFTLLSHYMFKFLFVFYRLFNSLCLNLLFR